MRLYWTRNFPTFPNSTFKVIVHNVYKIIEKYFYAIVIHVKILLKIKYFNHLLSVLEYRTTDTGVQLMAFCVSTYSVSFTAESGRKYAEFIELHLFLNSLTNLRLFLHFLSYCSVINLTSLYVVTKDRQSFCVNLIKAIYTYMQYLWWLYTIIIVRYIFHFFFPNYTVKCKQDR